MTNIERVLDAIDLHPDRNDDELSAMLNIRPRQQVNQICHKLEKQGLIVRHLGRDGKIVNKVR